MNEVPAVLKRALAERRAGEGTLSIHREDTAGVIVGDLRIVTPLAHQQTDSRIVLVLGVEESDGFADVMLVHSATEFATDHDAIVLADCSAPYDLVVQTDLRSVVWTFQLGSRVGNLSVEFVDTIKRWAADRGGDAASYSEAVVHHGTRLAGVLDRRWEFKESEGTALRQLASDCIEALLDQGEIWRVHPSLLRPEQWDHFDDAETVLGEFVHWSATRELSVDDDDLELLLDVGALDIDAWFGLGDLGGDVFSSLQEVLLNSATGVSGVDVGPCGWLTATHLDPTEGFGTVRYLGTEELVKS
ncbi:MAG: hypothetical protein F4Z58_11230 [Acidimicrobiaceae bacterium]|nr:hypothetical protein [Acidimicrobiaceae bacterium]MYD08321.1 hypothetical protein [Acidimicrobiaceae bacterium]MYI58658.1 hypothetical protein [Acidimicrobiaceae bacterium]